MLGAGLFLAGCTAIAPEPTQARLPATAPPSTTDAPTATSEPVADLDPDETCPPPEYWEDPYADGAAGALATLGGLPMRIPVDLGSLEYATGRVVLDENGIPAAYIAAPGDVQEFVAARLCLKLAYLYNLNSVRRDLGDTVGLFDGDTLNLNPYTVTSVGDQNGQVMDNPPPEPLPEQRWE